MNYYRKQSKNASLRGEKWAWYRIYAWVLFCIALALFGGEFIEFLNNY